MKLRCTATLGGGERLRTLQPTSVCLCPQTPHTPPEAGRQGPGTQASPRRRTPRGLRRPLAGAARGAGCARDHHARNTLASPRFLVVAVLGNRIWAQGLFSTILSICFDFWPLVTVLLLGL